MLSDVLMGGRSEIPTVMGEAAVALSAKDAAIATVYKDFTIYKFNDWLGKHKGSEKSD